MYDIEDSYTPTMILAHERSVNMIDNDRKAQTVFLELEYMIENVVMADWKEKGYVEFYKGQPKKWQVLNDEAFDRDQIEKIQQAVKAPSPDQLDFERDHTKTKVSFPFTNTNVEKWRDDAYFNDSVDFSPQ